MTIHFSELRSPQVGSAAEAGAVLVLPVGQIEEHGPHLPINCDALIVERICEAAIVSLEGDPPAYLMDTICYGFSQKALTAWPGTIVIAQETLIEQLKQIVVSVADMGFRKVVIVSGHGNHDGVLRVVARSVADARGLGPGILFPHAFLADLVREHSKAGPQGSCHAGEVETSLMLHLAPELVDLTSAAADDKLTSTSPYASSQAFVSTWTIQRSKSGAYGDPTVATAEFGKRLFDGLVAETAGFIRHYHGLKQI